MEITQRPHYLEGSISYTNSIVDYLKKLKLVDQGVNKGVKYFEEKVVKGGAYYDPKAH